VAGIDGGTEQNGGDALGGAIYNDNGALELMGCSFIGNQTRGGKGGDSPWLVVTYGGVAKGGALYSEGGQVLTSNCQFLTNSSEGGSEGVRWGIYNSAGGSIRWSPVLHK
jgi:hypothetical protein